jgi:CIC family chloride channel protein
MKFSKKLLNQCQEFVKSNLSEWRMLDADSSVMLVTSLIVGIGSGLGAVLFRRLIEWFQSLAYRDISGLLTEWYPLHLILIPALGGAIVGPLVYYFAREAKGHGVPEVMEALELRGGKIRPRVVIVKSLASSVCIASGGSVGREGPIAQIGSALGSFVGQYLKLSEDRVRTLVACGAAGGIAATFNAPIAGREQCLRLKFFCVVSEAFILEPSLFLRLLQM